MLVLSLVKLVDVGLHGFMLGILLYCTYLSAVYCQQAELQVNNYLFIYQWSQKFFVHLTNLKSYTSYIKNIDILEPL